MISKTQGKPDQKWTISYFSPYCMMAMATKKSQLPVTLSPQSYHAEHFCWVVWVLSSLSPQQRSTQMPAVTNLWGILQIISLHLSQLDASLASDRNVRDSRASLFWLLEITFCLCNGDRNLGEVSWSSVHMTIAHPIWLALLWVAWIACWGKAYLVKEITLDSWIQSF